MAIVLALLSALSYGISDFCAGVASRRYAAEPVAVITTVFELALAGLGVALFHGDGPSAHAMLWGTISGLGSGVGTLALYRGFAVGSITVVATLSAVLAAVLPVIVGLLLGNHLSGTATAGIIVAVPAIALVSWEKADDETRARIRAGIGYGMLAGMGFALLFIALSRAGTRSGAWPVVPGQAVGLLVVLPLGIPGLRRSGPPPASTLLLILGAGVLGGTAGLLFLAATGHGELAIVAVIASLYPAFTVLLARAILSERWNRAQVVGLAVAAASIVLVSVG